MKLPDKVKTALEEPRILILGAQILLGFQFNGVFSEGYDQLPPHSRYLDGLALGFRVCAVGLLIAPGPYHRIVERGEDSRGSIASRRSLPASRCCHSRWCWASIFSLPPSGSSTMPQPPQRVRSQRLWRSRFGMAFRS